MKNLTTKNDKIIALAQSRGSTANTHAGARRWLLKNLPPLHPGLATLGTGRTRLNKWAARHWREMKRDGRWDGRARILGYPTESEQWEWYSAAYEENRAFDEDCYRTVIRDPYSAVMIGKTSSPSAKPPPELAAYCAAQELIKNCGLDSYDTISFDDKRRADGQAAHIELYDFAPDGAAAVVCHRLTEGTHYGVATKSKNYYLITRADDGEIVTQKTNQPIARLAKMTGNPWGTIVTACLTGVRPKLPGNSIYLPADQVVRGFKLLARNGDEILRSVWDGSSWELGVPRRETVKRGHAGGLYYYRDLQACLDAAQSNSVFGSAHNHHKLIVVEVEATGRGLEYGAKKFAASQITPLREIAQTL